MNKGKHEKMALQGNRPATPFFLKRNVDPLFVAKLPPIEPLPFRYDPASA
jgi:hypothetical protein